jgi:hypothetical protein
VARDAAGSTMVENGGDRSVLNDDLTIHDRAKE